MFATIALLLLANEHHHNTRSLVSRTWAVPVVRRYQLIVISRPSCVGQNLLDLPDYFISPCPPFCDQNQTFPPLPKLTWSETDHPTFPPQTFVIKSDFPPSCHCQETLCCPDYITTRCSPVTVSDHPFLHLESPQSRF